MNFWRYRNLGAMCVAWAIVIAGPSAQGGAEHLLDLVDVEPPSADGLDRSELLIVQPTGKRAPTHSPQPVSPLTINLVSLDRSRYTVGDKVVYEVVVTNTSGRAFNFPTLVDPRIVRRDMPGATLATVGLIFDDTVFGFQLVALQVLYGAPAVPNSMELLQPGDTLRIRASGEWWLGSALKSAVPSRVVRDVAVHAGLWLLYLPDDLPTQKSLNVVPIQLRLNY
jgi:hypothetical protein